MIWGRGDGAVEDFIEEWEERRYQEPPEETTMMKQEITYENPPSAISDRRFHRVSGDQVSRMFKDGHVKLPLKHEKRGGAQ
jgi:hypothetical protein